MSKLGKEGVQSLLNDPKQGAFSKYKFITIGNNNLWFFIKYELITMLFGPMPGALGILSRRIFYRFIFKQIGRGVVLGRNIAIRNPKRIQIGTGAVIEDSCTLDAKGIEGKGIIIHENVFIGKGTIITTRDGSIEIGSQSNIGSHCRLGSVCDSSIGKKVLIAAYCYFVGAGHEATRTDVPIIDQPNIDKGGFKVGDGCWLGARVTVMDGTEVGHDTIIGAHALVTKKIPALSVAMGVPARVVKSRKNKTSLNHGE